MIYYKPGPKLNNGHIARFGVVQKLIDKGILEPIDGLRIPEVDGLNIIKDLNAEIKRLRDLLKSMPTSLGITQKDILGLDLKKQP